ncbi:MAG TPA: carboxypeptidase regulatory-like domain-containing protein [Pyrinomonadaceae bacterium]|jgi:plastocyanin
MQSNRARLPVALLVALCLLAASAACSRGADDEEDAAGGDDSAEAVSLTPYKPTGQEGSINGAVSFAGAPPAPKGISMDADPVCASASPDAHAEDIVVNGDKLANVLVYIKDGKVGGDKNITGFSFPAPAQAAALDQRGCHYIPHVLAVQVNQTVNVLNSDPTAHNVNVDAKLNDKFNQGQSPGAPPITKQFKRAETVIPVKCNQHPWMRAYVGVLQHPFFAVTDKDGRFEIKGVPAGTYTVVAWHEKYPQGVTQSVTVGAGAPVTSDFSFTAQQLTAESVEGGALRALPALDLPMLGARH